MINTRLVQLSAVGLVTGGFVLSGIEVNPTSIYGQSVDTSKVSTLTVEIQKPVFTFASANAGESVTTVIGEDGQITCGVTAGESGGGANGHIGIGPFNIGGGGHSHGSHDLGTVSSGAYFACTATQFDRVGELGSLVSGVRRGGSAQEAHALLGILVDRLGVQATTDEKLRWEALLNSRPEDLTDDQIAQLRNELLEAFLAVESVEVFGINRVQQRSAPSQAIPPTQQVLEEGPVPASGNPTLNLGL